MNLSNKKTLIFSLPMILAVFLLGGWFLFREQKVSEESPKPPVVGENPTQNPGTIESPANIDTSNWKTYRNKELGFEVKYPENLFDFKEFFDSDGGAQLYIARKGHSIDDINSTIVFVFNQLKSEKFYDAKKNGKCIKISSIAGEKGGIICNYEELANAQKSDYDLFLSNVSCNGFFEVWFDEKKRPTGDVFSYVKFGCTKEPSLERVYKAIYDSMVFFSPQSPN